MTRLEIALAWASMAMVGLGCGADDGGDDAAETAGDSTGATASATSPTEATATATATATDTDTSPTSASATDATESGTDPSASSGSSDGADTSSGDGGSSTTAAVVSASATLEPKSDSTASGTVLFTDNGDGTVDLVIEVAGVEPASATHALHIHEFPDCSAADGTSTGMHWNPEGTMLGELGTVEIGADGTGTFMKTDAWSIGTGRVNDVVDRSIIIHADPDGGTRIACGVITLD